MSRPSTRTTLLDAAEALFAEHGYDATSLRALTTRAGANLAAVNYHFGGKEGLAMAVLARRIGPLNDERLRRLDELPARPSLAAIVRAFVEPAFAVMAELPIDQAPAARMFGRMMADQPPFLRVFLAEQFRELGRRFTATLRKTLPAHDDATLWWRLHFLAGAMAHTHLAGDGLTHLTDGRCDGNDLAKAQEQLIAFAAAGLAAPTAARSNRATAQRPGTRARTRTRSRR